MRIQMIGALLILAACTNVVVEAVGAGSASGAGGSGAPTGDAATGTGGSDAGMGVLALCDPACKPYPGGACSCLWSAAPACPTGQWKACCVPGTPCTYPFDAGHEPAMAPGATPGWCSDAFVECDPSDAGSDAAMTFECTSNEDCLAGVCCAGACAPPDTPCP